MPIGSPLARLSTRSLSSAAKRPRSPDALLDTQQSLNAKRPKPVAPSPSVILAPQEDESKLKERKRAEREAQKEEFRIKYTRAFPKFSFYLHWDVSDGDPDARERLQARINYMDSVCLYFLFPYIIDADIESSVTAGRRLLFQGQHYPFHHKPPYTAG
jgi:regulatory subunit for Cdc7p protein kinase